MQPNVSDALGGWTEPLELIKISQSIVDYEKVETETIINAQGMLQQFSTQQLMTKPEGQRSYQWWMLHTLENIELQTSDHIKIDGLSYKVMQKNHYLRNGYFEYHIIEQLIN